MPVGISFYILYLISYNIEVYRGKIPVTKDFVSFALSVAYFPKLISGPISRPSNFLPQISQKREIKWEKISGGIQLLLLGFLKKKTIADVIGYVIDGFYQDPNSVNSGTALIIVFLYVIQIYADFSGYSDIARGLSKFFGIELMINFNQPFLSTNITDFWRRWHISLMSWLRDFIYIPLGGSQRGFVKMLVILMIVFIVSGAWHGVGRLYILWGFLSWIPIVFHKIYVMKILPFCTQISHHRKENKNVTSGSISSDKALSTNLQNGIRTKNGIISIFYSGFSWFITIQSICFTWIFFRATSLENAFLIIEKAYIHLFLNFSPPDITYLILFFFSFILIGLVDIIQAKWKTHEIFTDLPWYINGIIYAAIIIMILLFQFDYSPPFIYQGF
ncbi:MAG: MBOAT family O-acyltransferase [Candidatus Hodarchaeota archaeon]